MPAKWEEGRLIGLDLILPFICLSMQSMYFLLFTILFYLVLRDRGLHFHSASPNFSERTKLFHRTMKPDALTDPISSSGFEVILLIREMCRVDGDQKFQEGKTIYPSL